MSADRTSRPRLSRETLRDLHPGDAVAAAVRGAGDTSFCVGERCELAVEDFLAVLPRTHMSWGCKGTISIRRHDDGLDLEFDLHPNDELNEVLQHQLRRRSDQA